uniref:Uncharacterized protein n=1 Tax=Ascaris lumbricoides TaxID=6252 RepID=A0A0M3HSA5_ASCLU
MISVDIIFLVDSFIAKRENTLKTCSSVERRTVELARHALMDSAHLMNGIVPITTAIDQPIDGAQQTGSVQSSNFLSHLKRHRNIKTQEDVYMQEDSMKGTGQPNISAALANWQQ